MKKTIKFKGNVRKELKAISQEYRNHQITLAHLSILFGDTERRLWETLRAQPEVKNLESLKFEHETCSVTGYEKED